MAFKDCLSSTGCKQLRVLYSSVMGFAMFVVGIQNQDLCNNGGAYYLEVMGGLTLGILILMGMFRCCCDPDILRFIHAAGIIASLITYLWGSVAVFGEFFKNVFFLIYFLIFTFTISIFISRCLWRVDLR